MSRRDELFELHRRKFEKDVSFVIGEPVPKKQTLPKFKPYIDVSISLKNQSAARSKFRLEGADRQNVCSFEFQGEAGRQPSVARNIELWLLPDEHATILVRIIPPTAALIGLKKTVYHFTLTSTLLTGKYSARSVFGSFAVSPLIDSGVLLLSIFCMAAATLLMTRLMFANSITDISLNQSSEIIKPDLIQWATPTPHKLAGLKTQPGESEEQSANRLEMADEKMFQEIALQYGLNWHLLAEVAYQESRMNPLAIGKENELGLMQILPKTWYEWSPKVGVSDPFDRYSNVLVGAAYLAYVRDYAQSKGYHNEYWMLVGYNWGPNNLKQLFDQKINAIPGQQHQYATDILQAVSTGKSRWRKDTP